MDNEKTIEKLKSIIKPYCKNYDAFENLNEKTDLIADLQINSANLVDIILDIEEEFEITIDNQSMERMLDIQSVLDIISKKKSVK